MIFANPLGLLALLALPAIVALHCLRRRFRPRVVSGLFLYGPPPAVVAAGRTPRRLVLTPSLWFELLAALAAAWWLSDPHLADRERAAHLVLVMDSSRALQAVSADGKTAEAQARQAATALIATLARDDRVTVVASGPAPRLLAGPGARVAAARAALTAWRADQPWHEVDEALALGISLCGPGARTLLIGDRLPARLPPGVGAVACGAALPTSGLADARWLSDASGERVALRVLAHGGEPRTRRLVLRDGGGVVLAERELSLVPDQALAVVFAAPTGIAVGGAVEAVLLGPDPLIADDSARLLRPAPRTVRVAIDLPDAQAKPVRAALAAVAEAVVVEPGQSAHVRIGGGAAPPPAGTWRLHLTAGEAPPVIGPFLARAGDPLWADIDLTGVLWSGGGGTPADEEALLIAGDATLLSARRQGRDRWLTLACSLPQSTLTRHPAWPALVANLVAARRAALPGPADANVLIGQALRFPLPADALSATLSAPDGGLSTWRADAQGMIELPGLRQPGAHALAVIGAGGESRAWLTLQVNDLDPRLADLAACGTATRAAETGADGQVERSRGALAHLLPLIALALTALGAWWSFPREGGA